MNATIFKKSLAVLIIVLFIGASFTITPDMFVDIVKADLNDGLVGYWSFNDDSNPGGTLLGGASWTSAGKYGGAIAFDGIDDAVNMGSNSNYVMTTAFTFSAWIYPTDSSVSWAESIVNKEGEYQIAREASGEIMFGIANTDPYWLTWVYTGYTPPLNQWTHITWTYSASAGILKFVANGDSYVFTTTGGGVIGDHHTQWNDLRVGGRQNHNDNHNFGGKIDEVRIYNRALNTDEIQQLPGAGGGAQPPSENLISYWSFDEVSGSIAHDSIGSNDGTLTNMDTSSCWVDGISGNALSFDGVDDHVVISDVSDFYFADQSLTYSVWVQIRDNPNLYRTFVCLEDYADAYPHITLTKTRSGHSDGRIGFSVYDASQQGANCFSIDDGNELPKDEWMHVAGVVDYESGSITLYIDGEVQESKSISSFDMSEADSLKFVIGGFGCPYHSYGGYHYGLIDEVQIYDKALSEDQVIFLRDQIDGGQSPENWWDEDWQYRKMITIDNTQVTGDLSNFPVLISVTDSDLASKAQYDGDDIAFTDYSGNQLNHEIEYYNSGSGELVSWVNIPSLSSSSNTYLYMYYGNQNCNNQQDSENVWDSNFWGVYHLDENSGSTCYDSTSNNNHGTFQGTLPDRALSKIGYGQNYDGEYSHDYFSLPLDPALSTVGTYETWLYRDDCTNPNGGGANLLCYFKDDNNYVAFGTRSDAYDYNGGIWTHGRYEGTSNWYQGYIGQSVAVGQWERLTLVWQTNDVEVKRDKTSVFTDNSVSVSSFDPSICRIGANQGEHGTNNGRYDEVRISAVRRSNAWLDTSYNSMSDPSSFLNFGSEEVVASSENLPPETTITSHNDGDVISGQIIDIEGIVFDTTYDYDPGLTTYVKIDDRQYESVHYGSGQPGGDTFNWGYHWDTTEYLPGIHTISATSYDGNCFGNVYTISVFIENNPPNTPTKPYGENINLQTGVYYAYSTSTTDLDGDQIYYKFYWGEKEGETLWMGPFNSGVAVEASHIWTAVGVYSVQVKAKDNYNQESSISPGLSVQVTQGNHRPTVELTKCNPSNPKVNQVCELEFRVVDDSYAADLEIDWGDGSKSYGDLKRIGHKYKFVHTWNAKGSYQLILKSEDINNDPAFYRAIGESIITINVGSDNIEPVCSIESISPDPSVLGETIWLTANAYDPDGFIKKYKWYYNNQPKPFITSSHNKCSYKNFPVGEHEIKLVVVDSSDFEIESLNTMMIRVVDGRIFRPPFSSISSRTHSDCCCYGNECFSQSHSSTGFQTAYSKLDSGGGIWSYAGHKLSFNVDKVNTYLKMEARIHTRSEVSDGGWNPFTGPSTNYLVFWDKASNIEMTNPYDPLYRGSPYHEGFSDVPGTYSYDWVNNLLSGFLTFLSLIPLMPIYDNVLLALGQLFLSLNSGEIDYDDLMQAFNDGDTKTVRFETNTLDVDPNGNHFYPNTFAFISEAKVLDSDSSAAIASILEYILLKESNSGPDGSFSIRVFCPVNVTVVDPLDRNITKEESYIPNATYNEYSYKINNTYIDINIPEAINGTYKILVSPTEDADPDDNYTIVLFFEGNNYILVENNSISDIPVEPYTYEITKPFTPSTPIAIDSVIGKTGYEYSFNTSAEHPDDKSLFYQWDWDDGNTNWLGPFNSSDVCTASYIWKKPGLYNIKVKSKFAIDSDWSEPLTVLLFDGISPVSAIQTGFPKSGENDSVITSRTPIYIQSTDDYSDVNKTYYRILHKNLWYPLPGTGIGIDNNFIEYSDSFYLLDNGTYHIEFYSVDYSDNIENVKNISYLIDNIPPEILNISLPVDPINIGNVVELQVSYNNNGSTIPLNAVIDWGDGNISFCTINKINQTINESWLYAEAGVYTITIFIIDDLDLSDTALYQYIVIFDPSNGFVTGGGWIDSPEGAYKINQSISGKANFGFNSKYTKGKPIPTGNTNFNFQEADLHFQSTAYHWLVISGSIAIYMGEGMINGAGNYTFIVTIVDSENDMFGIKIMDTDNGNEIIYDNGLTLLGGGQIKIHNG